MDIARNINSYEYFHTMTIQTTVMVDISECTNLDKYILNKIKKNEGKCISIGYIKKDSINILSRTVGKTTIYNSDSRIYYKVNFTADICNPQSKDIVQGIIHKKNKMGILALGINSVPLRIIIARQHHDENVFEHLENKNEGDIIDIQIIGTRFNINDKVISVIGKIYLGEEQEPEKAKG